MVDRCILPWINYSTNLWGRGRPCGYSTAKTDDKLLTQSIQESFNASPFPAIRLAFQQGQWPETCNRCETVERISPQQSKKHNDTVAFLEHYDHLETNPDGTVNYFPPHIDLRIGPVCNQKCIHCGTGNSSKWLEDEDMIGKYENTSEKYVDHHWISTSDKVWDELRDNLPHIHRMRFLGGEPFAHKKHNQFIKEVSQTEHASHIALHYVTNGTLLTEDVLATLSMFHTCSLSISVDGVEEIAEFHRYPTDWKDFMVRLDRVASYYKSRNNRSEYDNLNLQWSASNISLFYVFDTLDYYEKNIDPIFNFDFCNHVSHPRHMSPQCLPPEIKQQITSRAEAYLSKYPALGFYINYMNEADLWTEFKPVFFRYLNDLDRNRGTDWRTVLTKMELHKYE
jgi:organic radical activating enzyme